MLEPHEQIRHWWDADAAVYDDTAGHAMSDPVEAATWRRALERTLPPPPGAVLDIGTGTASLALRAAELGFRVTGVDLSEGMLRVGREKAEAAGVAVELVHGAAEDPPSGPFDAVMERHVLWTVPRPVEALAAWRAVTRPGGRLVCFEGSWGGEGPLVALADRITDVAQRLRGLGDHHHASYPEGLPLPLQGLRSPEPYLTAIDEAGWTGIRLARLGDVEWAISRREPWPLGWLAGRPHYAIIADAPA